MNSVNDGNGAWTVDQADGLRRLFARTGCVVLPLVSNPHVPGSGVAVANGQRVPEDWHRLSAATLVQRALRAAGTAAWRMDASDVNLVFAGAKVASVATGAR